MAQASGQLTNRASRTPGGTVSRAKPSATRRSQASVVDFYTDDEGFKVSPVVVIGMSLGYIMFVTLLHIIGKLRA